MTLQAIYMALLIALVDCLTSCAPSRIFTEVSPRVLPAQEAGPQPSKEKAKKEFHQRVDVSIPIIHPFGTGELNADIFRPVKKIVPKTLVIIVPGSGNVSRRGEVSGDGIDSYANPLEMSSLWAKALSDQGFFVLSYDKRTCHSRVNPICQNNEQRDIDQEGILALAKDLDQTYRFALEKLGRDNEDVRIVLLSSTQGAETIALSESAKLVSGVVLLSPIVGDLANMWLSGLTRASEAAGNITKKNRLINQKESMAAFFTSLKKGDFPENSSIRGASVKFWLSWMEASTEALSKYINNRRPSLLLFSDKDSFSSKEIIKGLQNQAKNAPFIKFKSFKNADRNFTHFEGVPEDALREVTNFIGGLLPVNVAR